MGGKPAGRRSMIDNFKNFKRVSVVDDMAVQAYIALRTAMLAMQGMYQKKADELTRASANVEDEAEAYLLEGAAQAYRKVASDIGKFLNTKGGEKSDKV